MTKDKDLDFLDQIASAIWKSESIRHIDWDTVERATRCTYYVYAQAAIHAAKPAVRDFTRDLARLNNEIICRIDHGAAHGGHLDYVSKELEKIIRKPRIFMETA